MTNVQGKYEIKNIFFISKSKNFFILLNHHHFVKGSMTEYTLCLKI